MFKKKDVDKLFLVFIFFHLVIWTTIPSLTNTNLPLDTIEALAWGSNLDWGFTKHPPASAFFVEIFYLIFGSNDWSYYLLSQIFIVISFAFVFLLSKEILKNKILALISVLSLEGIYFFNFTSPEFNVNVCQIPLWAGFIYFSWLAYKKNRPIHWLMMGVLAGVGFLSKYLFVLILLPVLIFFILSMIQTKKINNYCFFSILVFLLIISPHLIWLFENEFKTINYAIQRSQSDGESIIKHIYNPLQLFVKQLLVLSPFLILLISMGIKLNIKFKIKDKTSLFLLYINLIPILFLIFFSLITGSKIRTMWLTPFYPFLGLMALYFLKFKSNKINLKRFSVVFLFFFLLSPLSYTLISILDDTKRTDYPGAEISYLVQKKWDRNFRNNISFVVGDEWSAGNLSYHLNSRPKWFNESNKKLLKSLNPETGVIYTGNPKVLKSLCPGVYGTIKPVGYCMIGRK